MVHPQNVQLLDVQLQNVQLQNVHIPDLQLQNVQITKRPDYQTSLLPNVQLLNVQLQNVHTSNYYKTFRFFLFSNTDNYDGFSLPKKDADFSHFLILVDKINPSQDTYVPI